MVPPSTWYSSPSVSSASAALRGEFCRGWGMGEACRLVPCQCTCTMWLGMPAVHTGGTRQLTAHREQLAGGAFLAAALLLLLLRAVLVQAG